MKTIFQLIPALLITLLSACTLHKIDIQQGNIITPEMMQRLTIGMDRQQVRFTLGTPPVTDPFHPDRWDYYYSLRTHGKPLDRKHFTLYFDAAGKLSRIVLDPTAPVPAGS